MSLDQLTTKPLGALRAWLPCVWVSALLVISRIFAEVTAAPKAVMLNAPDLLGETGVSANLQPLYLPGAILVAVVIATLFLHGIKLRDLGSTIKESSGVLLSAGLVLLFTVPMMPILICSGVSAAELSSMLILVARWVTDSAGGIYPLLAPSVGALGAFIAGSNTISNMLFSQLQFDLANSLGISSALIVAVQAIGASACLAVTAASCARRSGRPWTPCCLTALLHCLPFTYWPSAIRRWPTDKRRAMARATYLHPLSAHE
jgi:lactate permease